MFNEPRAILHGILWVLHTGAAEDAEGSWRMGICQPEFKGRVLLGEQLIR